MHRIYLDSVGCQPTATRGSVFKMDHATPIADVRAAATLAGAESFEIVNGKQYTCFRNGWGAARFLLELARKDARRPWVQAFALWLRNSAGGDDESFARALQAYGQSLPFTREEGEIFQGPALTAKQGGDCDCHARLLYSIAKAGGLPTELCFMHKGANPTHVFVQVYVKGAWRPLETTVAAAYGENPFSAARRLKVVREDIGSPEIITMGEVNNGDCGDEIQKLDAELQDELEQAATEPAPEAAETMGAITRPEITRETAHIDDDFFHDLVRDSIEDGGTPEMRAGVLLSESDFDPTIKNSIGCVGLNQFCPGTLERYWKGTADEYRHLSASQQLQIIRQFWRGHARTYGPTVFQGDGRNLYWINFVPDSYNGAVDDSWLIASGVRSGDDKNAATWDGSHDVYYRASGERMQYHGLLKSNPGFVTVEGGQRVIRAAALSRAIAGRKLVHPKRWAEIQARINFARGGGPPSAGGAVALLTIGGLVVVSLAKLLA